MFLNVITPWSGLTPQAHTNTQVILRASGSSDRFGVDFKITSSVRLVLLTVPLIGQILLAFAINQYPKLYTQALSNRCLNPRP